MNEELKKIITYVIDNGTKSYNWNENGTDEMCWKYKKGNYLIWFSMELYPEIETVCFYLTLFKDEELLFHTELYPYFDKEEFNQCLNKINELELIP